MSGITVNASLSQDRFDIHVPYHLEQVREELKDTVHGIDWHRPSKTWRTPASLIQIDRIEQWINTVENIGFNVKVTENAHELTDRTREMFEQGIPQLDDRPENDVLYDFQREGVNKIKALGGSGLMAWEVGAGKTPASIVLADELDAYPIVAVVPASVKYQWRGEIYKFLTELTDRYPNVTVDVLEGFNDELNRQADVVITNYSILPDIQRQGETYRGWKEDLAALDPGALIVDEAHMVRSPDAKRSKAVNYLADRADHTILLTGTPIVNEPKDLSNLLAILGILDEYGGDWGLKNRYYRPRTKYVGNGRRVHVWNREQVRDLEELHATLEHNVMSRIRKEDVFDEMPEKREHRFLVHLDNEQEYRELEQQMQELAKRNDEEAQGKALGKIVELRQACGKGKVNAAVDIVDHIITEGGAPLVFTEFKDEVANPIIDKLEDKGHEVSYITGDVKGEERQHMTDMYMEGITDVMVATSAAEEGVTLTRAHEIVMVEMPWTPKSTEQRIGRAHARMNDPHPVDVRYLIAEGTIDETVWRTVHEKKDVVQQAIDGEEGSGSWREEIMQRHLDEVLEE